MERILEHIISAYNPLCVLVYGSFADGTNGEHSDFDCMIITGSKTTSHDASVVGDVQLDLFIHTMDEVNRIDNYDDFVQIHDAIIVKDVDGIAEKLKLAVQSHIVDNSVKSEGEKEHLRAWLKKMLTRAEANDTEGRYRHHLALIEGLEIYFVLRDRYYFGPKKAISALAREDKEAYELFDKAMRNVDYQSLKDWIEWVLG